MNISIASTVLNEKRNIIQLIESLEKQTLTPKAIVVVDGGSTDGTVHEIKKLQKKYKNIKLFIEEGNIAHGRNFAISKAKEGLIVQIDAGCIADKNWLKNITAPFKDKSIDVVAGFYRMSGKTDFQKAVRLFLGVTPENFNKNKFLPSGRSVAFRKSIWGKIGGYNEKLTNAGEDTEFNFRLLKAGVNIFCEPSALVYWQTPNSLTSAFKKFFSYARGDAETSIWWNPGQKLKTHSLRILTIYIRYLIFLILLVALPFTFLLVYTFYLTWSVFKFRKHNLTFEVATWIPIIQIFSDFAVMAGFAAGTLYYRKWGTKKKQ